jgi:hypothetical protein
MPTTLALSPVLAAVYALLNVSALTALVGSRIYDDVPQAPTYPFVVYDIGEENVGGFGTVGPVLCRLRVYAYSEYAGTKELQDILNVVKGLLKDQALTATGFAQCGRIFYDDTPKAVLEEINGVTCREMASNYRIFVE